MKQVAVGLLLNEFGEVLMTMRGFNKPRPYMWEYPGGLINDGETPTQALAREWKEELGLDIVPGEWITEVKLILEDTLVIHVYQVYLKPNGFSTQVPKCREDQHGMAWANPAHSVCWRIMVPSCYLMYPSVNDLSVKTATYFGRHR